MWHFDMAVFRLAKVEDLLLRLLFEGTGAQFVPTERKNWDRQLYWDRVRDALKDRASVEKLAGIRFRSSISRSYRSRKSRYFISSSPGTLGQQEYSPQLRGASCVRIWIQDIVPIVR